MTSTVVHTLALLGMAFVLVTARGNGSHNSKRVSMDVSATGESVSEMEGTLDEFSLDAAPLAESNLPSVETDSLLSNMLEGAGTASLAGSLPTGLASGDGMSGTTDGTGGMGVGDSKGTYANSKLLASFFGAQAYGNRFVFVIDSSGSMRGARWEALQKELIRAIKSLSPDQEFFVISFDSMAHPMFGKAPPAGTFLKPTSKNVQRVQNWIRSIVHGRQTFPASSVGIAMALKPDAIFLLSDGEINDSTVTDLRVWNRTVDEQGYAKATIPIHTVLLHSDAGYATLEAIANENAGTFTPVAPR
jgi:hypothetical protein